MDEQRITAALRAALAEIDGRIEYYGYAEASDLEQAHVLGLRYAREAIVKHAAVAGVVLEMEPAR